MNDTTVRYEFSQLCMAAAQAYRDHIDALAREPFYARVLQFVTQHPDATDFFRGQFLTMVRNPQEELIDLIQFCMHQLQWQDIADAASGVSSQTNNSRTRRWMELIANSFGDTWPGLDYYEYYKT